MISKFNFIVHSASMAKSVLTGAAKSGEPIQWAISIVDPGSSNNDYIPIDKANCHLVLRFHDEIEEPVDKEILPPNYKTDIPPSPGHAQAIINFAERIKNEGRDDDFVLVHCHAGISRSPAALYIILCYLNEPGNEAEVLDELYKIVGICAPNSLLVQWGDLLLKREGRMNEALRKRPTNGQVL